MDELYRCQSCGMPLGEGFYGTEVDGSLSREFCRLCYQQGAYTQPNLTLREMVDLSVRHLVRELNMLEYQARRRSETLIPSLKRWQSQALSLPPEEPQQA